VVALGLVGLALSALPAFSADSGTVDASVEVAAACIQLSDTSVSFGTLPLGADNVQGNPKITVTNCSPSSEQLLARGTDAQGTNNALWTLNDSGDECTGQPQLGPNEYSLIVQPFSVAAVRLSTANKTVQSLAGSEANLHTMFIDMACPGSSGAGQTMNMQIVYTATF